MPVSSAKLSTGVACLWMRRGDACWTAAASWLPQGHARPSTTHQSPRFRYPSTRRRAAGQQGPPGAGQRPRTSCQDRIGRSSCVQTCDMDVVMCAGERRPVGGLGDRSVPETCCPRGGAMAQRHAANCAMGRSSVVRGTDDGEGRAEWALQYTAVPPELPVDRTLRRHPCSQSLPDVNHHATDAGQRRDPDGAVQKLPCHVTLPPEAM